jgi:formate dehydrogenase maturation protein FdhE
MTDEQYLNNSNICPWCKSNDIVAGQIEGDYEQAWQQVHCRLCRKTWNDVYNLVGYEEVK